MREPGAARQRRSRWDAQRVMARHRHALRRRTDRPAIRLGYQPIHSRPTSPVKAPQARSAPKAPASERWARSRKREEAPRREAMHRHTSPEPPRGERHHLAQAGLIKGYETRLPRGEAPRGTRASSVLTINEGTCVVPHGKPTDGPRIERMRALPDSRPDDISPRPDRRIRTIHRRSETACCGPRGDGEIVTLDNTACAGAYCSRPQGA